MVGAGAGVRKVVVVEEEPPLRAGLLLLLLDRWASWGEGERGTDRGRGSGL
jgi:hypothetical protein